jgi:hypothetical protein
MLLEEKKEKLVTYKEPISLSCDLCKQIYMFDRDDDQFHINNFIHIRKEFGYGSLYDGDRVEIDICHDCAHKLFKDKWRVT